MKNEINLLNQVEAEFDQETKAKRPVLFLSISLFILSLFLSVGAFLWSQKLLSQQKTLENKILLQEDMVKNLAELETIQIQVKTKLQNIKGILEQEPKFPDVLDKIGQLLPEGVVVLSFDLERSGKMSLTASATDSNTLSTFLDLLVAPGLGAENFINTSVSQITRNKEGDYLVSVNTKAKL